MPKEVKHGAKTPVHVQINALLYADTHGDAAAAREFGCDPRTIRTWRRKAQEGTDAASEEIRQARAKHQERWAVQLHEAQKEILEILVEKCKNPETPAKDVASSFKAVSEAMSDQAMLDQLWNEQQGDSAVLGSEEAEGTAAEVTPFGTTPAAFGRRTAGSA